MEAQRGCLGPSVGQSQDRDAWMVHKPFCFSVLETVRTRLRCSVGVRWELASWFTDVAFVLCLHVVKGKGSCIRELTLFLRLLSSQPSHL